MKRIIFLLIAIATVFTGFSQSVGQVMLGSNGLAIDTVTNTATETWTLRVPGYQKTVAVQVVATKISGTVAGTITVHGSLNGSNWAAITASPFTATDVASQSNIWTFDDSKYLYYRVTWTGTGTMVASARAYLLARRE